MNQMLWVVLAAMLVAGAMGCGPKVQATPVGAYEEGALAIGVQKIEVDDEKLVLKLTFINRTDKQMMVDRNQLQLRMPDGSLRSRYTGTFGGLTNAVHTIMPAMSHNVFVDFIVGEGTTGRVALVMSGVVVDGKPVALPEYPIDLTTRD